MALITLSVMRYLALFSTVLATATARTRSLDHCMPLSTDAPYGLSSALYREIYSGVRESHDEMRSADCSDEILQSLSSCDLESERDLESILSQTTESCHQHLSNAAVSAQRFLYTFGCFDPMNDADQSTVRIIFRLLEASRTTSETTTCLAVMRSARRAFEDSLLSTVPTNIVHNALAVPSLQDSTVVDQSDATTGHDQNKDQTTTRHSLWAALFAGALAGLAVDLSLFPLDTIKTRLQATNGFTASGGFKGLYQGIGSIALGSAPSSALFFLAYVFVGQKLTIHMGETFMGHLIATTIGELASSLVRVPADVVKSRQQVHTFDGHTQSASLWLAIRRVYEEGARPNTRSRFSAFYTGWLSSIVREIPFGCIQFPLFSYLKDMAGDSSSSPLSMPITALCGMVAGSFAGSLTTPLDVVKTRIMLAEGNEAGIWHVLSTILRKEGPQALFRGVIPRTLWISLGGAIFLGGYDGFARLIDSYLSTQ